MMAEGNNWQQLFSALMTGIGFTMSFFIDSPAFEDDRVYQYSHTPAILVGSLLSGMTGNLCLFTSRRSGTLKKAYS
jgi:NhaA family Na+:H+ antiporter